MTQAAPGEIERVEAPVPDALLDELLPLWERNSLGSYGDFRKELRGSETEENLETVYVMHAGGRLAGALRMAISRSNPELAGIGLTHSWAGFVAFTFDSLPHMGVRDGVHYALGYNGSGVTLSTWFGRKLGLRILGAPEAASPFADRRFSTRPFYTGRPWFLSAVMAYYAWRDSRYL